MSNEIETKEIEKPLAGIKQQHITTEQLLEKLLSLEKLLVKIEQKLNTPLIS
jgi:hypothetical protein